MDVRLSSNEGPLGPSEAAVAAVRRMAGELHLYPDDRSRDLREAVASREGVEPDRVALGTGSAGLLMDVVAHECADGGGAVVAFERSFVVYRLAAGNARATYREAPTGGPPDRPAGDGYARDVGALLGVVRPDTRVVMVDNPGNPTGAHLTGDQLRELLVGVPETTTVVVDEAYHHFAAGERGYRPVRTLEVDHPRLLTVRTFSKAHALAGLRVGYMIGPASLVASLDARRVRFNVNAAAQRAAVAALADEDHLAATVTTAREGRRRMADGLTRLGVPFTPGLGNFLTLELGGPAAPVVAAYAERGIGVRPLGPYGMDRQIRVTVGTADEVDAFLEASREVLAGTGAGW